MSDPEQIQRRIEQTRESLRDDIEAVEEKVSPTRVVGRRVERIRSVVGRRMERIKSIGRSTKERLMGGSEDTAAGSAASSDTAPTAPAAARWRAQSSRLVAGLVAFGAGYLFSVVLARRRNGRRKLTWRWPVKYGSRYRSRRSRVIHRI
jgi:hypothetical protein